MSSDEIDTDAIGKAVLVGVVRAAGAAGHGTGRAQTRRRWAVVRRVVVALRLRRGRLQRLALGRRHSAAGGGSRHPAGVTLSAGAGGLGERRRLVAVRHPRALALRRVDQLGGRLPPRCVARQASAGRLERRCAAGDEPLVYLLPARTSRLPAAGHVDDAAAADLHADHDASPAAASTALRGAGADHRAAAQHPLFRLSGRRRDRAGAS